MQIIKIFPKHKEKAHFSIRKWNNKYYVYEGDKLLREELDSVNSAETEISLIILNRRKMGLTEIPVKYVAETIVEPFPSKKSNCRQCNNEFVASGKGSSRKVFCSKKCSVKFHNSKREEMPENRKEVKFPIVANCVVCDTAYTKLRSNHLCCSPKCSTKKYVKDSKIKKQHSNPEVETNTENSNLLATVKAYRIDEKGRLIVRTAKIMTDNVICGNAQNEDEVKGCYENVWIQYKVASVKFPNREEKIYDEIPDDSWEKIYDGTPDKMPEPEMSPEFPSMQEWSGIPEIDMSDVNEFHELTEKQMRLDLRKKKAEQFVVDVVDYVLTWCEANRTRPFTYHTLFNDLINYKIIDLQKSTFINVFSPVLSYADGMLRVSGEFDYNDNEKMFLIRKRLYQTIVEEDAIPTEEQYTKVAVIRLMTSQLRFFLAEKDNLKREKPLPVSNAFDTAIFQGVLDMIDNLSKQNENLNQQLKLSIERQNTVAVQSGEAMCRVINDVKSLSELLQDIRNRVDTITKKRKGWFS